MPKGTDRQHRESGERKTCCLLGNRLSEMYIMSYFCDLDRENQHTLHSCISDNLCIVMFEVELKKTARARVENMNASGHRLRSPSLSPH